MLGPGFEHGSPLRSKRGEYRKSAPSRRRAAMTVSYFVRYGGEAEDRERFIARYRERHVPIPARRPRLRRIVLHVPAGWNDPFPVNRGGGELIAQLVFDTQQDLDAALGSAARRQAREDYARFPRFPARCFIRR